MSQRRGSNSFRAEREYWSTGLEKLCACLCATFWNALSALPPLHAATPYNFFMKPSFHPTQATQRFCVLS